MAASTRTFTAREFRERWLHGRIDQPPARPLPPPAFRPMLGATPDPAGEWAAWEAHVDAGRIGAGGQA